MLEGLRTAAAGMIAQQHRIDTVAHDLANVNTTGYKHLRVGFRDLVYQDPGRPAAPGVQTGAGAAAVEVGRSFAQGAVRETGRPLDVAIQGQGFFVVRLPDGREALTRDGVLHRDADGRLATETGARLEPQIAIPDGVGEDEIAIDVDGRVLAAGREVGRLRLVDVRAPQNLQSVGDNAFLLTAGSGPAVGVPAVTGVRQGALEASNVEISASMVGMIEAQRGFELASKAILTADQMLEIANGVKR